MIKKLTFSVAQGFENNDQVIFYRPFGSKLHRVKNVPLNFPAEKQQEIIEVLNTLCLTKHKNIWYFKISDRETEDQIGDIFYHMEVSCLMLEPQIIPKILN